MGEIKMILVTGGTGFLGEHLALSLVKAGYHCRITGRNRTKGERLALKHSNLSFMEGDLRSYADCQKMLVACKKVVHCGALSTPWGKKKDFWACNVYGTEHLIRASLEAKIERFIHISSPSIYQNCTDQYLLTEDDRVPTKSLNHYIASKKEGEKVIQRYKKQLPCIILRPRGIFGPGDTTLLPRLLKAYHRLGIPKFREKAVITDISYVDNVVQSILAALEVDKSCDGEIYHITNGEPQDFHQIVEKLLGALDLPLKTFTLAFPIANFVARGMELVCSLPFVNKEPLLTRYTVSVMTFSQSFSIEKAKKELNYKPTISIDEGIQNYAEWWKSL